VIGTVLNEHHALASAANFTAGMAAGYRILAGVLAVATMCATRHSPTTGAAPR
jgi:hypothetical protein